MKIDDLNVSISDFKRNHQEILNRMGKSGKKFLLTKRGQPIALIEPLNYPKVRKPWLGSFSDT